VTFFAVLDSAGVDERTEFEVTRLHLNLWSLAAIGLHRRMFVFDVGVRIAATTRAVTGITLALPFDTLEPQSLFDKVMNPSVAELIFDANITAINANTLNYQSESFRVLDVRARGASRVKEYTSPGFSLWDIPLSGKIEPGEEAYIRLRFPVTGTGRTWQWTKTLMRRTGAVLDFRISDLRSSKKVPGGNELIDRVRPIKSVAAFVMAPIWMHGRTVHPEPRYIRLLEGRVWAEYLDRAPELSRRSRLVVYYWRFKTESGRLGRTALVAAETTETVTSSDSETAKGKEHTKSSTTTTSRVTTTSSPVLADMPSHPRIQLDQHDGWVTIEHPARMFADFKIDTRAWALPAALWGALLTAALVAYLFDVDFRPNIVNWWNGLLNWAGGVWPYLSGAVLLGLLGTVLDRVGILRSFFRWLAGTYSRFEALLFRLIRVFGPRD
jgi:hypothetical protein